MPIQNIISVSLQNIALVFIAFICGFHFTNLFHEPTSFIGGLWAVMSGIIVLESTAKDSIKSAKVSIVGTLIGAIISGLYIYFFEFSVTGYVVCVGLGIIICHIFNHNETIKLTIITISVILIVTAIAEELHPIKNAGLRFAESIIGAIVAILVAYSTHHINKKIIETGK